MPRVLVYAGIDEAGYGPVLGPLCVAATAFAIDEHDTAEGAPNLWQRLKRVVCRKATDKKRRIAVDDSKKLKGPNDGDLHPLRHLERGVIAFASHACELPEGDSDLYQRFGVEVPGAPWYGSHTPLPVAHTCDELRIARQMLSRAFSASGVRCELLMCEAIDAGPFNQQVQQMGNKSNVNFCAAMRLAERIWRRWPDAHPRIVVDRQGGRMHYLRDLQLAFPDAFIEIVCEEELISRYRLSDQGRQLTISFVVEAESAHLPVALASMTAKYVRELLMMRLNRYFKAMMPELKPTAGYYGDGRRYLADIEPLILSLGVDRAGLVRCV
jgi:ribonuclease HII